MKIIEVKTLVIDAVKVIRFARFIDHRGYFTEHFRRSDFQTGPQTPFFKSVEFVQCNESFSRSGVLRGLHFQWNPFMGKLVRTVSGHMLDIVLDIRKGSPTYGKAIIYDMKNDPGANFQEWIWVPPGFAHGNFFKEDTTIEYLCSGEYSQGCEAGISPLAPDIDWTLCENSLKKAFDATVSGALLITDKDKNAFSLAQWGADPRSENFKF